MSERTYFGRKRFGDSSKVIDFQNALICKLKVTKNEIVFLFSLFPQTSRNVSTYVNGPWSPTDNVLSSFFECMTKMKHTLNRF